MARKRTCLVVRLARGCTDQWEEMREKGVFGRVDFSGFFFFFFFGFVLYLWDLGLGF